MGATNLKMIGSQNVFKIVGNIVSIRDTFSIEGVGH